MKSYRQLSAEERVQIATLRYQNFSLPKIAQILGRHRTSVWREVKRNRAPPTTAAPAVPAPKNVPWPGADAPGVTNSLAKQRWDGSKGSCASNGVLNKWPVTCERRASFPSATRRSTGTGGATCAGAAACTCRCAPRASSGVNATGKRLPAGGQNAGAHHRRTQPGHLRADGPLSWPVPHDHRRQRPPSSMTTARSKRPRACPFTSPPRATPGSAAPTKTPTDSSASIYPKEPVWLHSPRVAATPSPTSSTSDPEKDMPTKPRKRASMLHYKVDARRCGFSGWIVASAWACRGAKDRSDHRNRTSGIARRCEGLATSGLARHG